MQSNNDPINIQHKCSVIIKKPKYIINDGWTWIIAAVENGKLDENSTEQDIFNLKVELVKENKVRLNQFLKSNDNKKSVLFDPCPYCIDVPYYIIGDNINKINGVSGRNYIADDLYSGNDRILNCTVTQELSSGSQCSIMLDNTGGIYTLHNEFYYNSESINLNYGQYTLNQGNVCVIEPNDEVEVYMSDWQGNFNCVFTGYVSNVAFSDDGLQKRISLQCDDITKKLNWIYFNAQAGFDVREARGVKLSAYTENQQPLQLNEVVSNVLAETYCDIYKRDSFVLKLVKIYAQIWNHGGRTDVKLATANLREAYYKMRDLILDEIDGNYVDVQYTFNQLGNKVTFGGSGAQMFSAAQRKETGRIGYKNTVDYAKLLDGNTTSQEYIPTPFLDYDKGDIAFKIEGMNQIAWAWTTHNGSYDYLFSNYKKSLDFVREIANIVQYEFFANPLGTLYFRPPNFTLPMALGIFPEIDEQIQKNYWVDGPQEQYFTNFNSTVNDNKIYTRVNVIGHNKAMNFTHAFLKSACYAPQWYLNKYGLRIMPTATKIGLVDDKGCQTYGELLLNKNNINYELCSASCVLNSNYVIGKPIFIRRHFAVWYIGRVMHNFNSGGNCTTELTLTYKRTPLCLKKDLERYVNDNKTYGKLTETEADYIIKNVDSLTWATLRIKNTIISSTVKVGQNVSLGEDNYDIVWQPLIGRFYDVLECLLEQQADTATNINQNRKQVQIINKAKKSKKNTFHEQKKEIQYRTATGEAGQDMLDALKSNDTPHTLKLVVEQAIAKGVAAITDGKSSTLPIEETKIQLLKGLGGYMAFKRAKYKYVTVPRRKYRANMEQQIYDDNMLLPESDIKVLQQIGI